MRNKMQEARFQIGKNGASEGTINSLALVFKNHKQVRITALKASGRDKDSIREIANALSKKLSKLLPYCFDFRIIGFTIVMKRHLTKAQK